MLSNTNLLFGLNNAQRLANRAVMSKSSVPSSSFRASMAVKWMQSDTRDKHTPSSRVIYSIYYETRSNRVRFIYFLLQALPQWETSVSCRSTTREETRNSSTTSCSLTALTTGLLLPVPPTSVTLLMLRPRLTTGSMRTGTYFLTIR